MILMLASRLKFTAFPSVYHSLCLCEPSATSRPGPDEVMDALLGKQQDEDLGVDPQVDVRTSGHLQDF